MSNRYPPGFLDLLTECDGPVLDNGAGGRTHRDIVTLEIAHHPANSVQADALDLPFRDDTFSLILSQAVLEHVNDPQRYVDEAYRVLRPGGVLFVEAAFLQPIHQAPHHYFGITPFGLRHVCRRFDVMAEEQFGSLADQLAWILTEAGATAAQQRTVTAVARDIEAAMTPLRRWNTASGVRLIGRKP